MLTRPHRFEDEDEDEGRGRFIASRFKVPICIQIWRSGLRLCPQATQRGRLEARPTLANESSRPPGSSWAGSGSARFAALVSLLASFSCFAPIARADFQGATHITPFDEDTIAYSKTEATGPVARLKGRLDKGEVDLNPDDTHGYLPALLEALHVPRASQMLVFSKTSFQRELINPKNPRGIFFSDDVYIGYVPGSQILEVSEADPKLGGVFYTLEPDQTGKPRLRRNDQCLECHASAKSMGVPGHLVRSFATDDNGVVDLSSGTSLVNHRTPIEERWGGWYVSGTHGQQLHRGNLIGKGAFERQEKEPNFRGNQTDLSRFFDTKKYPSPHSDLIALMVLEHQTHMHNFITRLNYEATLHLQHSGHTRYLKSIVEAFLKYLLFAEEAPVAAPLRGTSDFAKEFASRGPTDKRGRSLREFDLHTRLFKYPCSFLIYSEAFDHLPQPVKEQVYHRLWEILSGQDTIAAYAKLDAPTRGAIAEILIATKPGLPAYWKLEEPAGKL
jgi:hypothetical protein